MTAALTRTFSDRGDFVATHAVEAFLKAHGFSFGAAQGDDPRGILFGQRAVAKWRGLTDAHRSQLDGVITGDMRTGPITVTIFARAPAAARVAVSRAA